MSRLLNCEYESVGNGRYECQHCGHRPHRPLSRPPVRRCGAQGKASLDLAEAAERLAGETGDPTIIEKASHYARALLRWKRAGYPVRANEVIKRIYREHCGPCDLRKNNSCRLCGCRVVAEGAAVWNKIKMATEKCDKGKWGESVPLP